MLIIYLKYAINFKYMPQQPRKKSPRPIIAFRQARKWPKL